MTIDLKQSTAILLIALLLTNHFGYRVIFMFAEQVADNSLETALDNIEYEEDELLTITVPLSNPYQLNQSDFERVDGEINIDGKVFRYVKRKIVNGDLILKCIPHHEKMKIQYEKLEFLAKTYSPLQFVEKNKSSLNFSITSKSYVVEYESQFHSSFNFLLNNTPDFPCIKLISAYSIGYRSIPIKPPRFMFV